MSLLEEIIHIARQAWESVMDIYHDPDQDFELDKKDDNSPLTKADLASHNKIVSWLESLNLWYPIMSEEGEDIPYQIRKDREKYRCIDPLDGTKEFIKRNGEFTINIALIQDNKPVLGVVYVPVQDKLYAAYKEEAYMIKDGEKKDLQVSQPQEELLIVWSRSHHAPEVEQYVSSLADRWYTTSFIPAWSSLKFCLIAEGKAHVYPRFIPTMERDTAAAQCVLVAAWWSIVWVDGLPFTYNKENLRNWFFIASADEKLILTENKSKLVN